MDRERGYIYVRNHQSYDIDNACKMGKAMNIPERDTQYATGEIRRGYFEVIFEIPFGKVGIVERLLQYEFRELNVKYDAGTEFYKKTIITLIEPYLISVDIKYKKLTKQEINDLVRCNRVRNKFKKIIQTIKFNKTNRQIVPYVPRDDQAAIVRTSKQYFELHDKGILVLTCGVGKTLISLWISKRLKSKTILIGVPNKLLLKQWEEVICVLFKNIPYLVVFGGMSVENITEFLKINKNNCAVITTYSSAHKVYTATQKISFTFGMKVNDEVHHLTADNMKLENTAKKYIQMLNIPSIKQLSLTATLKQLENEDEHVISNDNVKYFGEIIDRKSLLWAINNNIVCDYVVQTIITDDGQLDYKFSEENDKRLFLSAFAALKSVSDGNSHHLLIYTNNQKNSLKLSEYIKKLIDDEYFDMPELFHSNYHSEMKLKDQKTILKNFEESKFGIIVCVYCLGEGWDFPLLDGVVFAENMSSNIRIVQSALRASRKNKKEMNKKAKIILPILNRDDWLEDNENPDLKKVREIIYQMGLEDETIEQKIKVFKIGIVKQKTGQLKSTNEFEECDDELTQQLRLKTIKRIALAITYDKAKKILFGKNIKNKTQYYELCKKDSRLPEEPEITFKGKFINWIDYLCIDRVYYELEMCKDKVAEYLSSQPEINIGCLDFAAIINKLCELDEQFPPNDLWSDYYNVKDLFKILTTGDEKQKISETLT
jgi:superfamily II DNA or RNA helicase